MILDEVRGAKEFGDQAVRWYCEKAKFLSNEEIR